MLAPTSVPFVILFNYLWQGFNELKTQLSVFLQLRLTIQLHM